MTKSPQLTNRLAVSLLPDDPVLLEQLRAIYEKRAARRLSWAKVVRITIYEQALSKGIINETIFNTLIK